MMAIGGKAYAWNLTQGWRNASTPVALGSHAGAKNTGSLAVSEAGKKKVYDRRPLVKEILDHLLV